MSGVHEIIAVESGNGVRGLLLLCGRQGRGREGWAVALGLEEQCGWQMHLTETTDWEQGIDLFGHYSDSFESVLRIRACVLLAVHTFTKQIMSKPYQ